MGLAAVERRKSVIVACVLIGSGLNLAIISWFVRTDPNIVGVAIGLFFVLYGVIAFGARFLPEKVRLGNKPSLIQYMPLLIVLLLQLPGLIFPPFPLPYRKYIWDGSLLLLFLPWFWPTRKREIRDDELSH